MMTSASLAAALPDGAALLSRAALGIAMNGLVLVAAWLLSRAFGATDRSTRIFHAGVLASALIAFPMLLLGTFGALDLRALFGVEALLAVAALGVELLRRRRSLGGPHREGAGAAESLRREPNIAGSRGASGAGWARPDRVGAVLVAALLAVGFVPRLVQSLIDPPLQWDSLYYHLPVAVEWMQTGALGPLYHPFAPHHGYLPGTGELFFAWAMWPLQNDAAVAVVTFLFLALGALSLHRIALSCGVTPATARWVVPLYALTPAFGRAAGSAYVEPALNAFLFCALAALLDFRRSRRAGDGLLFALSLALAIGTKATALGYAAILCAAWLAIAVRRQSDTECQLTPSATLKEPGAPSTHGALRALPRRIALGCVVLLLFALGGSWYVRNARLTGNPVYPNEVRLGGGTLFEGIPKMHGGRAVEPGYRMLDGIADAASQGELVASIVGTHAPMAFELGLGPKVLALALAFAFALGWALRRGSRPWFAARLVVAIAGAFFVLLAMTPLWQAGWLAGNIRFAAPFLGLAIVLALILLDLARVRAGAVTALAALACVPDVLAPYVDLGFAPRIAFGMGLAALTLVCLRFAHTRATLDESTSRHPPLEAPRQVRRTLVWGGSALAAVCVAALPFGCAELTRFREARRHDAYASRWDLHETLVPAFAAAFAFLDAHAKDTDVVAQSGFEYLYPLYGPRLARRVRYVDVNLANKGAHHGYALGTHRDGADPGAWLNNLRAARARWLAVARPWHTGFPLEAAWADARPDVFSLAFRSKAARIYSVHPAPGGAEARAP